VIVIHLATAGKMRGLLADMMHARRSCLQITTGDEGVSSVGA
jgi:hypothetical protein